MKSYIFEKKKNAMIQVKIVIEDELGKKIEVNRSYNGELVGKNLDEIESLISGIQAETMAASELSLLELNQAEAIKKKVSNATDTMK